MEITHGSYTRQETPGGGSSKSPLGVGIMLADHSGEAGDARLYESVEAASDPLKNVGTRHNYSNLTNFAQ
ncbi:MAG: hypothetical protein H6765_04100 [Candidatus Peribacteria bacterium]|nr:MAG: hypothetical protein H6765_04100 [Candidatus Peribacteria bacterium]